MYLNKTTVRGFLRRTALLLSLFVLLSALGGCTGNVGITTGIVSTTGTSSATAAKITSASSSATTAVSTTTAATAVTTTTTLSAQQLQELALREMISAMTVREKVGQLFVAAVSGTALSEQDRAVLTECAVGNVILFGENVGTLTQLAELNRTLRKTIREACGIDPFISIDQEGGIVERIKDAATAPKASVVGRTGEPALAGQLGKLQGAQLYTLGINLNFAPVADVDGCAVAEDVGGVFLRHLHAAYPELVRLRTRLGGTGRSGCCEGHIGV